MDNEDFVVVGAGGDVVLRDAVRVRLGCNISFQELVFANGGNVYGDGFAYFL